VKIEEEKRGIGEDVQPDMYRRVFSKPKTYAAPCAPWNKYYKC